VRFGRFDEVVELTKRPERDIPAAAFDFSMGYAKLKLGEPEFASAYLAKVKKVAETSKQQFRTHPANKLVGILGNILEGEMLSVGGNKAAAIEKFELAVKLDDELDYDEPEPLPFPARHWLGAALLDMRKFVEAEQVYRDDLKDHPHNGWSLLGLQQALKGQGRTDAAVDADFAKSWSRSDTWIRWSRF
jgi:tetratricopeptide (TPR) repeat protein